MRKPLQKTAALFPIALVACAYRGSGSPAPPPPVSALTAAPATQPVTGQLQWRYDTGG